MADEQENQVTNTKSSETKEKIKTVLKPIVDAGVTALGDASKQASEELKEKEGTTWYEKLAISAGATVLVIITYLLTAYHDVIVNFIMNIF